MRKVLYICCGNFQKKIIRTIKKKGFNIYGIDERDNAESKNLLDKFYNFKIQETKKIFSKLKKIKFSAIISLNSDAGFNSANKLSKLFNLEFLAREKNDVFFKKSNLNIFLKKNKFPCKKFFYGYFLGFKKDYIYKPNSGSGSRGIFITTKKEFKSLFINAKNLSIDNKVFCQEIIDGKEFTFDCLVYDNKIIDFIISEKIKVKNIKYVSQTILLSSINKNERKKFYDLINRFLEKININQGIFHFEIIRDKNSNLFIIDVAPRGPGFFVLEDYLNNISSRNWINDYLDMVTNQFNKKKFKSLSKKPHLIHFITKKNGTYKYIKILKNNLKYKITYFVKNNTQTVSSKNDSSRIASIILNNKNSKKLLKDLKVIKKSFIPKYSNENY